MVQEDIPKRVILVLLILTVVISILGTWTVLDAVSSARIEQTSSQGQVSIGILTPNPAPPEPLVTDSQATVGVNIIK